MGARRYDKTGRYLGRTESDSDRRRQSKAAYSVGKLIVIVVIFLIAAQSIQSFFRKDKLNDGVIDPTDISSRTSEEKPDNRLQAPDDFEDTTVKESNKSTQSGIESQKYQDKIESQSTDSINQKIKYYPPCSDTVRDQCIQLC